jgi:hypothetical protein
MLRKTPVVLAGLLASVAALAPVLAADSDTSIPAFHVDAGVAWLEVGDELLPPPSGPGPVTNDPRYPYVDNGAARRRGIQSDPAGLGEGCDEEGQ